VLGLPLALADALGEAEGVGVGVGLGSGSDGVRQNVLAVTRLVKPFSVVCASACVARQTGWLPSTSVRQ
jgi:hypothetical protein